MFGFGHDEEVGGEKGAGSIAKLLASRNVQLEIVNDEGGMLSVDGLKPLTSVPVALVGTAEKVTCSIMAVPLLGVVPLACC